MNSHPDETNAILAKHTGLDLALIKRMSAWYAYSTRIDAELVDRCLNLMYEQGYTKQRISASEIIYSF